MTISELKNMITVKGLQFMVLSTIDTNTKKYGFKTIPEVDKEFGENIGFESYLKKIANYEKKKNVNIIVQGKNGTDIKTGKQKWGNVKNSPFFVQIEPTENTDSSVGNTDNTATLSVENTQPIVNKVITKTDNTENNITPQKMQDLQTHIENASMKTELMFLKAENDRLKESNKKLDQKNEDLFSEVSKLSRELSTTTAKADLDYRKKEIELLHGQKESLGGIDKMADFAQKNPETAKMIIQGIAGFLKKDHPMFKEAFKENGGSESSSLNGPKHEDSDTQEYIEHTIYPMLAEAPSGVVGMIGGLIQYFIKFPDHLAATYKKWLPGVTIAKVDSTSEEEEDEDED